MLHITHLLEARVVPPSIQALRVQVMAAFDQAEPLVAALLPAQTAGWVTALELLDNCGSLLFHLPLRALLLPLVALLVVLIDLPLLP